MTLDELDRLAAEKVMGWSLCDDKEDEENYCMWLESNGHPTFWYLGTSGTDDLWQPTRNIAQAFELLDKFHEFYIKSLVINENKTYECEVFTFENDFESKADTAPEAIVRACLKAKGIICG